jgi:uncharacterized Rmd1/YagE family protein
MSNALEVYALCQCAYYELAQIKELLAGKGEEVSGTNVLHVRRQEHDIFVFEYGVIVFWGVTLQERAEFLSMINPFAHDMEPVLIDDEFTYALGVGQASVKDDHIQLPDDDRKTRLAFSHGIAQSTRLSQFEAHVQNTISDTAHIPRNIAETGKSGLAGKEIARLRGRLFLSQSDIMLNYDLLDVPEFFWENPELNPYYTMIADYLEIRQRVDVLSKKVETIHELFNMMADEQNHRHSSLLEWIIIWLIAFEILVFLVHDILGWL